MDYWTNKWADLLQVNRKYLGEQGAWAFHNWIRQAVASNMPYDEFARAVLTASGSNLQNPPASYFKILRTPEDTMENTTQLFLAIRFNCNKCHDHPFERWTQDQYYQLSAYFAQVGLKKAPAFAGQTLSGTAVERGKPLVEIVYDQNSGDVTHARTGQITPPEFPFTHGDLPEGSESRREQLSHWLTSKENPYFAKSYANRIWSYLLGRGLIDPVDDIRAGNPASNPELLDWLTKDFVDSGFDARRLMTLICKSRVYQHSLKTNKWNADDDINYSHAAERRLPAETLYDCIHRATGTTPKLPGVPVGFRAAQLPDSAARLPDGFFNLFGKPPRESSCECERSSGMMLGPVLNLINGPTVADAIAEPNNRIHKLVREDKDDAKLVEDLFLAILCRPPTPEEVKVGVEALRGFDEEHAQLVAAVQRYEKDSLPKRFSAWTKTAGETTKWTTVTPSEMKSAGGATLEAQPDGSILVSGANPATDTYTITAPTEMSGITGVRLEVLPDASLPAQGPGRAANGNFVLNQLQFSVASDGKPARVVAFQSGDSTFSQNNFEAAYTLGNKNAKRGWAVSPQFGKAHMAIFETKADAGEGASTLTFMLSQNFGGQHTIGRFRLSVTNSPRPLRLSGDSLPKPIADILAVPADKRTAAQLAELEKHYRTLDTRLRQLQQQVADHMAQKAEARLRRRKT